MAFKDLRHFLTKLEEEGELLRIEDELLPEPDIGAMTRAACDLDGPAILCENVAGYDIPLALGIHASQRRVALALGLPKDTPTRQIFDEFCRRWDSYPVHSVEVKDAPCQEITLTGDEVDLTRLPLVRLNEKDGGLFINKSAAITRDPETGILNFGEYRLQLKGPRTLNMPNRPIRDAGMHFHKARRTGQPLEIAIAIGLDPAVMLAAVSPLPIDWDEFSFAGALRGQPLEVTKAKTVDLPVPANAEIIIEGVIPTDVTSGPEGPYGEFTGYVSQVYRACEIHVNAITCRAKPIMESLYIGVPPTENDGISHIPNSVAVYKQAKRQVPEIEAFNLVSTWCMIGAASIRKVYGGQERKLMNAVWATPLGCNLKCLFVVDEDIDPFDMDKVFWAMATRFQADQDIVLIPNGYGSALDPSAVIKGRVTNMGLDCTWPMAPTPAPAAIGVVKSRPETAQWRDKIRQMWERR